MFDYYIFITPNLSHIGGAELYMKNKAQYLKDLGIKVLFITGDCKEIKIKELFGFEILEVPQIIFPIYYYNKKNILNHIIKWLKERVAVGKAVIESHNLYACTWGEMVAKELKAENIVYFLAEENIYNCDETFSEFIQYKADIGRFFGITEMSNKVIFGENFKKLSLKNNFFNIPVKIEDYIDFKPAEKKKNLICKNIEVSDFNIITITRLEKNYLSFFLDEIVKCKELQKYNIKVFVIGDSNNKNLISKFRLTYENCTSSVKIFFLGYIYPLTKEIFEQCNIYIGMGTTIINAASMGCASIIVDPRNNKSAGIFGIDNNNFAFSKNYTKEKNITEDILRLIDNPELMKKAQIEGKTIFNEKYEFFSVTNQFLKCVVSLFENKKKIYFSFNYKPHGKELIRYIFFKLHIYKIYMFIGKKVRNRNEIIKNNGL